MPETHRVIRRLRAAVPLAAGLARVGVPEVARLGGDSVPHGGVYIREGDPIEHFYGVSSGEPRVTRGIDGLGSGVQEERRGGAFDPQRTTREPGRGTVS